MVRVDRMTERRVIRRAADDALMGPRVRPDGDHRDPAASVLSDISTMASGHRSPPWYLSRRLLTVLAVAVIVALAAWGIVVVLRSPDGGPGELSPTAPSTAGPAPTSAPLEVSRGDPIVVPPPLPPPPPPPPPPAAEQLDPSPRGSNPYPRSSPPDTDDGPEVGVTRTPITRAPMSVAPTPRPPPRNDSSTPGDGQKSRGFPF